MSTDIVTTLLDDTALQNLRQIFFRRVAPGGDFGGDFAGFRDRRHAKDSLYDCRLAVKDIFCIFLAREGKRSPPLLVMI